MAIRIRDPEVRMKICRQCPEFRTKSRTCRKCNCIMPIKTKIKSSACPLNKW